MKIKESMKAMKVKTISLVVALANKIMNEVNFVETINKHVTWDEKQCDESPGNLAKALVLATFTDMRVPLTHIQDRTQGMDLDYLLGKSYMPHNINEFNVGRALERIGGINVNQPYETLALSAMQKYEIPIDYIHSDTTTISFSGVYDIEKMNLTPEEKTELLKIEKGFNKDGRPGDRQIVVGQMVGNTGIPLRCNALDGSTSDVEWNKIALDYYDKLREHGFERCIYVADCKLVTQEMVTQMNEPDKPVPFVSRCPDNFNELQAKRAKRHAYANDNWTDLGQLGTGKQASHYRGYAITEPIFGTPMRLLVLESSALREKAELSLEKHKAALAPLIRALEKKTFACYEDADKEYLRFTKQKEMRLFTSMATITETIHEKWPPGRRSAATKPTVYSVFTLGISTDINPEAYAEYLQNESSFVLISNVLDADPAHLLKIYKGQHVVETSFRHLKSPSLASVIYLKNPKRIEALTMLLSFSLLIRAIIQYRMRDGLQKHQELNPNDDIRAGWAGRKLENPTFHLLYEHAINCKYERVARDEYIFDWPNVETKWLVLPLLELMGYTLVSIFE